MGPAIAATLLRGLSWVLIAVAALIGGLTVARMFGFQSIAPVMRDLVGAGAFAVAAIAARLLARRFAGLGGA
jgi:hypothetical protein